MNSSPIKDDIQKFKRYFDFVPYVEPTLTNFLERENNKLRKDSQTLVIHGDLDNNKALKDSRSIRQKMS